MTRPDSERAFTAIPELSKVNNAARLALSLLECVHPYESLQRRNRSSDNPLQPLIAYHAPVMDQIVEKGFQD